MQKAIIVSVNQRFIARALNFSPATVSKAFRNSPDISSGTKALILDEASKLGYRVPLNTKSMNGREAKTGQKSGFVGVFYCHRQTDEVRADHGNVLYLNGLSKVASLYNSSLIVHRVSDDGHELLDPAQQPVALREGLLSGVVLIYRFAEDVVRQLAEKIPVVTLTHWVPGAKCDHVDSDHISGIQRLVAHLKGLGHRRIGFATHGCEFSSEQSRFSSFMRALVHEGLEIIPEALLLNRERRVFADELSKQVIDKRRLGVTAWVCASDAMANYLIESLKQMGCNVPGQLSITGFDRLEKDEDKSVLTSVKTPIWEMGIAAMEQLMRRVNNPGMAPGQLLIDCPLVVGGTTGPVEAKMLAACST